MLSSDNCSDCFPVACSRVIFEEIMIPDIRTLGTFFQFNKIKISISPLPS